MTSIKTRLPEAYWAGILGSWPRTIAVLPTVAVVVALAGCGGGATIGAPGIAGKLGALKSAKEHCDGERKVRVAWDLSGTGRGDARLDALRLDAVRGEAQLTAACKGHLEVVAFAANEGGTIPLGERDFPSGSGTENARLIRAAKAVDALVGEVRHNLTVAARTVGSTGTDVLPQFGLAGEVFATRPEPKAVLSILTDGIQTRGADAVVPRDATDEQARAIARRVEVPNLRGAEVRMAGIGQVAGTGDDQPTPSRVAALRAFYETVCEDTGATCMVTTTYTTEGSS